MDPRDFETRRSQHHEKVMGLNNELRGAITGVFQLLDAGRITPERALDLIREKHERVAAEVDAASTEYRGSIR